MPRDRENKRVNRWVYPFLSPAEALFANERQFNNAVEFGGRVANKGMQVVQRNTFFSLSSK